ncbi:MAG: hypothetical protein Q8942_09590 [Bacillota bacterium]|nr:hypothetical protein [Bacillota bacterium]
MEFNNYMYLWIVNEMDQYSGIYKDERILKSIPFDGGFGFSGWSYRS